MSGGYGSGGYPGQGYEEDPRQRRQGGGPRRGNEQGYGDRGYNDPGYRDEGYDPRAYDQQGSYDQQGTDGYRGPQQGQYGGPGGAPQYDRRQGSGPYRPQDRAGDGYDQRGGRRQRYDEWDESDSSILPGFGGRADRDNGRYPQDRDDRRAPRDARGNDARGNDARGPEGRSPGRGDRGPGDRDPRDRGDRRPLPDDDWDDRNRKPRKKATRWLPRILVLAVVAVVLIGGGVGGLDVYHKYEARYHPADYTGPGTTTVVFQVVSGDTAFSVAPRLYKAGIIASERAFTNAAESATTTTTTTATGGSSSGLEVGYYSLHLHMQASLAYAALINPKNAVHTAVTISEGKRVSQTLQLLATGTKIPLSQFEAAAKETAKLGLPSYAGTTVKLSSKVPYGQLEGYLFPATYLIQPHETALQILQAMVARYNVEATQLDLATAAQSVHLTPGQLIIEASMVQAEAASDAEMPDIASVFDNRKAAGMAYGSDAVVGYGLGEFLLNIPNGLNPASAGPYDNTQVPGLPPTPIDNPGEAAIQAVLHPATTDYLYFLAGGPGKPTRFSHNCQDLPGTC